MLIAIDASRAFISRRTGVENYSYQLLLAFANLECQQNFCVYTKANSKFIPSYSGQNSKFLPKQIPWSILWTQGGLALETWLAPPDLLFIPAHTVPFLKNPKVKTVVTVHDLWTHDLPQSQNPIQRMYLNLKMERLRARMSTHLIAVSQSTKKDILKLLDVPEEKVSVVYEGIDHDRFTAKLQIKSEKLKMIREKYSLGEKYLLFVGTIQPRKNLARLIEAFLQVANRRELKTNPHELVLAGQRGWMADEIYAAPQKFGVGERVKFIDYIEDDDLPYLYAGAYAFLMPSLHEGFGLPVLEAMACGTPAVISCTSSLPEVGGSAAVYVDPTSVESISKGILQVLNWDEKTYQQKSQECIVQAQKFSWEKCAQETLKVFEKVLRET